MRCNVGYRGSPDACKITPQASPLQSTRDMPRRKGVLVFDVFDQRQLRLLVTAVSAQRLFWVQQEALAHSAMD